MAQHITADVVQKLKPPTRGNQKIIYDDKIKGFGVRITRGGAVSFILNYYIKGRERRMTIASASVWSVARARTKAIKLRLGIESDKKVDPLEEREAERTAPTMNELAAEYLAWAEKPDNKRPSSVRNDKGMLANIVQPRFGTRRVADISRRDVEELKHLLEATPVHANRVLALLSKMFSLARERGYRPDNPVLGMKRFAEKQRKTWLDDDEQLCRLLAALEKYPGREAADCLSLILLTGSRSGEAMHAEWPQFDLDRGVWTKPAHFTKQKLEHVVPLNDEALKLLQQMKAKAAKDAKFLFPGRSGDKARVTLRKAWAAVSKEAGLDGVRVHDLRHTFASRLVSSGESLYTVGKLLGHTQASTTQRYAHLADSAQRAASNTFGGIYAAAKAVKKPASTVTDSDKEL